MRLMSSRLCKRDILSQPRSPLFHAQQHRNLVSYTLPRFRLCVSETCRLFTNSWHFLNFVRYSEVHKNKAYVNIAQDCELSKATQGYTRLYKAIRNNSRQFKAIQGYQRLSKAFQGYPRPCKDIQGYPKLVLDIFSILWGTVKSIRTRNMWA